MNEVARQAGAPMFPSVNLLPSDIGERKRMRAVQVAAVLTILAALALVGLAFALSLGAASLAERSLDEAIQEQAAAIESRDARADVYDAYRAQEQRAWTLLQIGYGEADTQALMSALLATVNESTSFQTVQYSGPTAQGLGSTLSSPLAEPGIGSIDFSAFADSFSDATRLIERIEAVPGLADVNATSEAYQTSTGTLHWEVQGSASVTSSVLTGRFITEGTEIPAGVFDGFTGAAAPAAPAAPASEEPAAEAEGDE